jgi:D-amino-acid oxidase
MMEAVGPLAGGQSGVSVPQTPPVVTFHLVISEIDLMRRRVLVIGAGVSGLTTAKSLVDAGFAVTVVAEKRAEFTPSIVAGALWEWPPAVCGHHTDLESLRRSKHWAVESYRRFEALAAHSSPGVRLATAVFYFRHRIEDRPMERQKMEEVARHVHEFERSPDLIDRYGVNREFGLRDAYCYVAPLIDTDVYMQWLRNELRDAGCRFDECKLTQPLESLEAGLCAVYDACAIVNCSGLGSIQLAGDAMAPLRGALVRVRNDGATMPRVGVAHCVANDDANPHQQMIYIIPRGPDHLLLGGIAELGEWDVEIGLENYEPVREMLRRCQQFLPALESAVIDEHEPVRVGLRPYREKNVRLEREGSTRIIHNYGHGGSGFTFSWGCGAEVASLVKQLL